MDLRFHSFAGCAERFLTWLGAVEEGAVFRLPLPHGRAECTVHADHVACTAGGEQRRLPASGPGAAGVLPAMKELGALALVYASFYVDLQDSLPPAKRPRNTALTYQCHASAGGYERSTVATVVFSGAPAPGEAEILVAALADGDALVPGQIGLADLQEPGEGPWHQVLRITATDAPATDSRTFSQFAEAVARLVLEHGWDEDHVPQLAEAPVARPAPRVVEA